MRILRFQGGGLYIDDSAHVEMMGCSLYSNTASGVSASPARFNARLKSAISLSSDHASTLRFQGGGLYITGSALVEMTGCSIYSNIAEVSGCPAEFNAPLNFAFSKLTG